MKYFLLAVVLIFSTTISFAQKEKNIWYFGNFAGIDFNSGTAVAVSSNQMTVLEGCANISDKTTGQILFYTDGDTIWNSIGQVMTNGTGLLGDESTTQSAIIVPVPGSTTLFYVFTQDSQDGKYTFNQGELSYNIVDLSLNGGLGAVTVKNQVLMTHMTEKLIAVRACNGTDIWVITHQWNSDAFYTYLITSAGISAPLITNTGIVIQDVGSGVNAEMIGYMKCSPDGKKLVTASYYDLNTVQIFDFDNATGVISNPVTDTNFPNVSGYDGPYGATFSPDNSKLYIGYYGSVPTTSSKIFQYNMLAGNGAAILASRTLVASTLTETYGALQIGPDGKIYITKYFGYALDVINNPNALGAACNFVADALVLTNPSIAGFGLPNFFENSPYTGTLTYTGCGGNNTVGFTNNTITGTISCLWDFGDALSGASDSSTLQNPTHIFSSSGTYTVKLYISNACTTDSVIHVVNISGSVDATAAPADTAICDGDFIQLQATGGITYTWSPSTGLSDPNVANPIAHPSVSTTYTVTASPIPCADSTATVNIVVHQAPPTPFITQSQDTLFCSFDPSYTTYQWYSNDTLIAGATNAYFVITHDGNFNVAVTNANGCLISVGTNIVLGLPGYTSAKVISLSPNPAGRELKITNMESAINQIEIVNILGERIHIGDPKNQSRHSEAILDISPLSSGVYFVQIVSENGRWVGKFIKE